MLVQNTAGLCIPHHDYVTISPPTAPANGDQIIVYKLGGAAGTTVATLTVTYVSNDVSTVVRG